MQTLDYDTELLARAQSCWDNWNDFREDRDRCKRFTYGDQWSDTVDDGFTRTTEEKLLISQGNLPLKNNLIRRLVRNVLGVYRNRWKMPECRARDAAEAPQAATLSLLLRCNMELNRMEELYARTMEEFLISGLAVHKKWYGRRGGMADCWTDLISPTQFFMDREARDFRGHDLSILGEIHDIEFDRLCAAFATSPERREEIGRIYGVDWRRPAPGVKCRLTEVWTRSHTPRYHCHDSLHGIRFIIPEEDFRTKVNAVNAARIEAIGTNARLIHARWQMDEEWRVSFLAPSGALLARAVSPYPGGSHPYIIKAYPFVDGEIHSFVSDIIDQQKITNRLISMYDWILRASAKGVLLFPEGALPEGTDMADIADEWSRFNGVIIYRPRPGIPIPQQVSSNSTNIGITELLSIQMKMMEDISGVNGALQGKLDNTSMSGTLYSQQTQNSLSALADLLRSFDDFMLAGAEADAANIRKFYTPARIAAIAGVHPGLAPHLRSDARFFHTPFDITFSTPSN